MIVFLLSRIALYKYVMLFRKMKDELLKKLDELARIVQTIMDAINSLHQKTQAAPKVYSNDLYIYNITSLIIVMITY